MNKEKKNKLKWISNNLPKTEDKNLILMSPSQSKQVHEFHMSFPQYKETPLVRLSNMSAHLGLKDIFLKDESYRFGLNAFKVLGGSYAIARYISSITDEDISKLPYSVLTSDELRNKIGEITFYTATDGNHGRGVAWAANKLNQKCVVYMPAGTTQTRLNHVLNENATATIEALNYDDCVRKAYSQSQSKENAIIIQDTAWDGYEEIPAWIMQGYGTMALEADTQMQKYGCERPTHIFIQAGVGSLAGAVQGYFTNKYSDCEPKVVVVEAEVADCLYKSAIEGSGNPQIVGGDMLTLMNGLACGEPCTIAWGILKNHADTFVSCPDWVSALGMRLLAAPSKGDAPVTSGESGAVTMGLLYTILTDPEYKDIKEKLGLDENSSVMLFSTEGDTDPERYRSIVWEGMDSL
ncbi:diaminopropionate ammonia-lyase [Proteocatella sphenisci]|uniref:diaminopropionate ammonia-lyase n=1 Tax=Proteocatella sphenisci TaxID=181070 RepID=UPI00048D6CE4|nr:diaminopropionate ammonia-lyase [Proteocatella sphenisci]